MRIETETIKRYFEENPEDGRVLSSKETKAISLLYTRGGVRITRRCKIFCSEENRQAILEPGDRFFIWAAFGGAPGGTNFLGYLSDEKNEY